MIRSAVPFLRTLRWRRLLVPLVLVLAWHVHARIRFRQEWSALRATGWATSPEQLRSTLPADASATNLPAVLAGLAGRLRASIPSNGVVVDEPESRPGQRLPQGQQRPQQERQRKVGRHLGEIGQAGPLSVPVPFPLYARVREVVESHAAITAELAAARRLTDHRASAALLTGRLAEGHPDSPWDLAVLSQYRAVVAMHDGRSAEAADAVGDILMVARSLEEFPDPGIQALRGRVVGLAARTLAQVASGAVLDDAHWAALQAGFARVPDSRAWGVSMRGHVAACAVRLRQGRAQAVWAQLDDWDRTHRVISWGHRLAGLERMDRATGLGVLRELAGVAEAAHGSGTFFGPEPSELGDHSSWNRVGELRPFTASASARVPEWWLGHLRAVAYARGAVLVCAIQRHRLARGGGFPATLDDLSPGLLPEGEVPADPFTGCPLSLVRLWDGYEVQAGESDPSGGRASGWLESRSGNARWVVLAVDL